MGSGEGGAGTCSSETVNCIVESGENPADGKRLGSHEMESTNDAIATFANDSSQAVFDTYATAARKYT